MPLGGLSWQVQVGTPGTLACERSNFQRLSPDEVRQLLLLLNQAQNAPRYVRRFLDRFKQHAIARQVDKSVARLFSRTSRNGWTYGPSVAFLEWSAVPRFAVMRWAKEEDFLFA